MTGLARKDREDYVEIRVSARADLAAAIETALLELGAQGTAQELGMPDRHAAGALPSPGTAPGTIEIVGYFTPRSAPDDALLRSAIRRFASAGDLGVLSVRSATKPGEDWVARTRMALGPFRATPNLWIAPPWEMPAAVNPGEDILVIEPAQAFGTGTHGTTRACLHLIESWAAVGPRFPGRLRRNRALSPAPALVLDIGTGTGILALRALQVGAALAYAIDTDAEAIRALRGNAALNGMGDVVRMVRGDARALRSFPFDLILANVFLNPLLDLAGFFHASLASGGSLILSGFRPADRPELEAAMEARGLRVCEDHTEEDWPALRLQAAGGAPAAGDT